MSSQKAYRRQKYSYCDKFELIIIEFNELIILIGDQVSEPKAIYILYRKAQSVEELSQFFQMKTKLGDRLNEVTPKIEIKLKDNNTVSYYVQS